MTSRLIVVAALLAVLVGCAAEEPCARFVTAQRRCANTLGTPATEATAGTVRQDCERSWRGLDKKGKDRFEAFVDCYTSAPSCTGRTAAIEGLLGCLREHRNAP